MTTRSLPSGARALAGLLLAAASGTALAHGVHVDSATMGFGAGLAHPLAGADHLLAMVAVGLWAMQPGARRSRLLAPLLFVAAMSASAWAAASLPGSVPVALLEAAVAGTVIAVGALLTLGARMPTALALAVIAMAGGLHGAVHGLDAVRAIGSSGTPAGASLAAYVIGMASATAALHSCGIALGDGLRRRRAAVLRWSGPAIGAAGLAMLLVRV